MKKYTDTELLNILLPMLNFYTETYIDRPDLVKIQILGGTICYSTKDFITSLQNRLNELKKMDVRVTDTDADDSFSSKICEETGYVDNNENDCCQDAHAERTYSSEEYYDLMKESLEKDHEITLLKRKVEALEYLIYNCIPKDDRRKYYN